MKKVFLLLPLLLLIVGCSSGEKEHDYESTNSSVVEGTNNQKSQASVIAEQEIKKLYGIENVKIKYTDESFDVRQLPDDRNADTGQEYKNLFSCVGDFVYQDSTYKFTLLYSLNSEDNYDVLYLSSKYDESKTIDTPLESDQ